MPEKPHNGDVGEPVAPTGSGLQSSGRGGAPPGEETAFARNVRLRARVREMIDELDERAKSLPSGF